MPLQPPTSKAWSRLAATVLWVAVALIGAGGWMEMQPAGHAVSPAAMAGRDCVSSGTVVSASARTPRTDQQSTAECCDDGDCLPGQCPTPCRGRCACLVMHGTPLSTTAVLTLSGLVAFGPMPTSDTALAPPVVSREPALRPPIA